MVTSFDTGHIGLFNMETQQLVLKLESAGPPGTTTSSASICNPRTKRVNKNRHFTHDRNTSHVQTEETNRPRVHVSLFVPDHVTDLLTADQLLRAPPAVSFFCLRSVFCSAVSKI